MRYDAPTLHRAGRAAAAVAVLAFAGIAAAQTILYVSPGGRDEWSGTMRYATRNRTDGPKKTIAGARDAIRLLKAQGRLDPKGAIVYLASGTYPVTSTIVFDSRDSGTAEGPIVYRAQVQGKAILDGGRKLTNWTSVSPSVAAYLKPEVRNKVMQCRLGQLRITRAMVGEMIRRGWGEAWNMEPPAFLTWDGTMMPLASSNVTGSWLVVPLTQDPSDRTHFRTTHERAKNYSYDSDIWVQGYFGQEWADDTVKVKSINASDGEVTLETQTSYALNPGARYRFINVLEELDSPGEWYLDRRSSMLFFYPPIRSQIGTKTSIALLQDALVKIWPSTGTQMHLRFEGLTLQNGRGNGTDTGFALVCGRMAASDVGFYGCTFRCSSRDAVFTGYDRDGSQPARWTFESCDFHDLGARGIILYGGDRATLTPSAHLISNCHFYRTSLQAKCLRPGVELYGVGSRIIHCLFEDMPHQAVLINGNNHYIEYSAFRRICTETIDSGAIYGGRDWTARGVVIKHNRFENVLRPEVSSGAVNSVAAIYLDDGMSGWVIDSNVFDNVDSAVKMNASRDVRIHNNLFKNCTRAFVLGDWLVTLPDSHPTCVALYTRLSAMPYSSPLWQMSYPQLAGILSDVPKAMRRNSSEANVLWSCTTDLSYDGNPMPNPPGAIWFNGVSLYRNNEYVGSNPGFTDYPKSLRSDTASNAARVGFSAWPIEEVGLRSNQWRSDAP